MQFDYVTNFITKNFETFFLTFATSIKVDVKQAQILYQLNISKYDIDINFLLCIFKLEV